MYENAGDHSFQVYVEPTDARNAKIDAENAPFAYATIELIAPTLQHGRFVLNVSRHANSDRVVRQLKVQWLVVGDLRLQRPGAPCCRCCSDHDCVLQHERSRYLWRLHAIAGDTFEAVVLPITSALEVMAAVQDSQRVHVEHDWRQLGKV